MAADAAEIVALLSAATGRPREPVGYHFDHRELDPHTLQTITRRESWALNQR